jgi:signal transduction histidine kinase
LAVRNEFLRRLGEEQIVTQLEATLCHADGSERICEIYGSFIETQGRKLVMTSYLDITERKLAERAQQNLNTILEAKVEERTRELAATMRQLETANTSTQEALETLRQAQNELVRSEKMAGLGSLVAGIAHELNTPIGNAVMISSTLSETHRRFCKELDAPLKRSTLLHFTENVGESCAILSRNLERAIELVSSFKQVAVDQSSYQRRHFELQEVADEIRLALSPTLRRATTELSLDIAPQIMLDSFPGPLGQILMNLINNALIHAFDPGQTGHITIVGRQQENGWITLTISDDGKGIPAENLGRIFDPFFTTRLGQGGSGLGLNITYNLVTGLLGGTIDVSSRTGQGTRFDINIPSTAPPDSKTAARNAG